MQKLNYNVIGVMSGTSLDGIDLAHIEFTYQNKKWNYKLLECETIAYPLEWLNILKIAVDFSDEQLLILDKNYTSLLASAINTFIKKHKLSNIDAVCSHGHTIKHEPENSYTLQIGNLPIISELINQKVVCNFRVQDVKLGGQGAPLVPIGDKLLFSNYTYCLNLGGFSNISFENNTKRVAFDICPVNTVLNFYANKIGLDFDNEGKIAQTGNINQQLFKELNNLEFYTLFKPKSLGFEFVKNTIIPIIEGYKLETKDILCTFIEHIACQISKIIELKNSSILITGGGVFNTFLIKRIKFYIPNTSIELNNKKTIEYKEALIFGLLGVLRLENKVNVLSSVTGASKDHSSGEIY